MLARLGQDPAGYGLIHADLHLGNVLDHYGQARPIDFDDAAWGHYAVDLAIAADSVPEALRPVLLGGYQTVGPLPPGYDEHQATLLAARRLFLATCIWPTGCPTKAALTSCVRSPDTDPAHGSDAGKSAELQCRKAV